MSERRHINEGGPSADLARLSHDLRTPIHSITGFAKVALDHLEDTAKVQDCLQKILISGQHMTALINDLLDQGRLESGKVSVACMPFSLAAVASWIEGMLQLKISEKQIDFSFDLSAVEHVDVVGDEVRLKQVLQNLASNAVKFTPPHGKVSLTIREDGAIDGGAWFTFDVVDTGCGMSPEFMGVLFEPFSRESLPTSHPEEGTGLGMVIAKGLVELMGGSITVESQVGAGTSVTVRLPLLLQDGSDANNSAQVIPMHRQDGVSLQGCHVLVADDDDLSRELLRELLGQYGIDVTEASDGREAFEAVMSSPPHGLDAVLVDMRMPQMDGLAVTRAIRALEREDLASLPVIAVSADSIQRECDIALGSGLNAYVTKPFDAHQLLDVLRQHVVLR